jgi:hypothetical protein
MNTCLSDAFDLKEIDYHELGELADELQLSGGEISALCYCAARLTISLDHMKDDILSRTHQINQMHSKK